MMFLSSSGCRDARLTHEIGTVLQQRFRNIVASSSVYVKVVKAAKCRRAGNSTYSLSASHAELRDQHKS